MRVLCVTLAVTACGIGFGASPADDKSSDGDMGKLQGTWTTMIGPDKTIPMTMEVKGSDLRLLITPLAGRGYTIHGQLKLDELAKPKAMDWTKLNTNGKEGPDIQSIYELDGDTLRICGGGPGKDRPAAFKGDDANDPRARNLVFKRAKGEPKAESAKEPSKATSR